MPTYTFKNKTSGEQWTDIISIASRDEILKNKNIIQLVIPNKLGLSGLISGTGLKPDDGLRSILKEIKKVNPGNTIDIM